MDSDQRPISDSNATLWPKRASRACASCRRDKIRCDGARPCSGCTKKGYSTDQCIDGCDPCRRARARCENGKPCQRCRDMQLECTEEPPPPSSKQDNSGKGGRPGSSERAKLACTNCRRDNKKCDDQRPCSRCVSRSEECIHVGRGPKLVKLRCEGCRQEGKRCEDTRPCANCVDSNKECVTQPRKGRGHGTRVKAACVTCRRDKVRCDGVRPCAVCIRKGQECVDRACKSCAREGNPSECTHRKNLNADTSDDGGRHSDSPQDHAIIPPSHHHPPHPGPSVPVQLPPLSQVQGIPPPHMMYPPMHQHPNMPPIPGSQNGAPLYYPSPVIGPGQLPPPGMIPAYLPTEQRTPYYSVMNPNVHSGPPGGPLPSLSVQPPPTQPTR